ncbi:helix-turn-helix protein [compost metagenome]
MLELTNIKNKTLSGYETAKSEPDLITLSLLANLYKVSIDWIINGREFDSKADKKIAALQKEIQLLRKIIDNIRRLVSS